MQYQRIKYSVLLSSVSKQSEVWCYKHFDFPVSLKNYWELDVLVLLLWAWWEGLLGMPSTHSSVFMCRKTHRDLFGFKLPNSVKSPWQSSWRRSCRLWTCWHAFSARTGEAAAAKRLCLEFCKLFHFLMSFQMLLSVSGWWQWKKRICVSLRLVETSVSNPWKSLYSIVKLSSLLVGGRIYDSHTVCSCVSEERCLDGETFMKDLYHLNPTAEWVIKLVQRWATHWRCQL